MKSIAAPLANWFLPGLGYILLGQRVARSVLFLIGAIGLTYVEFGIKEAAAEYYLPMFVAVLVMNTGFAVDAWLLARKDASAA